MRFVKPLKKLTSPTFMQRDVILKFSNTEKVMTIELFERS
jgi:hypothetical protein